MINQYKRSDVFLCLNSSHEHFGKRVSVYHVLKAKQCFPNGCVYFLWRCKKLNKGERCPRGYEHVGRKCFGCKEFYDKKMTNHLQVALSEDEWQRFQADLREFEDWLSEIRGRMQWIRGVVSAIKPHFLLNGRTGCRLSLKGFILTFRQSFIGQLRFEDYTYARVTYGFLSRYGIVEGDELEFEALVREDHGRIVFFRLRNVERVAAGGGRPWSLDAARLAARTATPLPVQLEKCHACPHGVLVDISADGDGIEGRKMFCLEGIHHPRDCVIPALERLSGDQCDQEEIPEGGDRST
jgi:hypothetical protein